MTAMAKSVIRHLHKHRSRREQEALVQDCRVHTTGINQQQKGGAHQEHGGHPQQALLPGTDVVRNPVQVHYGLGQ